MSMTACRIVEVRTEKKCELGVVVRSDRCDIK
jgi:hypothetical protein